MLAMWACSDPTAPEDPFVPDVVWTSCSKMTGGSTLDAECAMVAVPVRWDAPRGPTLELFVKRIRGTQPSRGQLWLIAGGPGNAGDFFETILPLFTVDVTDLDIYLLDHRGTGRSTRLGCAVEEAAASERGATITPAEMPACLADVRARLGDTLEGYRPTEAAHDLRALIEVTRTPSDVVVVYGRSYGTYLVQRYLQLAPAQPTAVILDSTCAAPACTFPITYDLGHDEVARAVLEICGQDDFCRSKLPAPVMALENLLAILDGGHCGAGPGASDAIRARIGFLEKSPTLRPLVPALIYRLTRCRADDTAALASLDAFAASLPDGALDSRLLRDHIIYSELWEAPTPAQETALAQALAIGGLTPNLTPGYAMWPRYTLDPLAGDLPETDVPLLMMQGLLDPQTTTAVARPMRDRLHNANQHYVEVPLAAHGVINNSLLASSSRTCGSILVGQFLADPIAPLDLACVSDARPIDFVGTPELAAIFGQPTVWGD